MTCVRIPDGIVCFPDASGEVRVRGRLVRFDFSSYGGPLVVTEDGTPWKRQPGERSAFWPAFEKWFAKHRPSPGDADKEPTT